MIFNTWTYAAFLPLTVALHWLLPPRWRPVALIAFGSLSYWYYYPPHAVVVAVLTLFVYAASHRVRPDAAVRRRAVFAGAIAVCLGALAYYKYQGFAAETCAWLLARFGAEAKLAAPTVRAPLAISFFTFEYVHYLVEVYRGRIAPVGLERLGLFVMFFPTLVCGPIKRFPEFDAQVGTRLRPTAIDLHEGLARILFGFAKKTLVADRVAPWCADVLGRPELVEPSVLWLAVYGYAIQIYFDFAGYSDIAIGSARLFGYRVPENFDRPYLQPNIARFWRSWHISLTSWIGDYVYRPLGGNRRSPARTAANRLLTMGLCGLWHGAAFHFVVWGLYHGLMLNAYHAYMALRRHFFGPPGEPGRIGRLVATVLTFHVVCLGWVLFVCDLERAWAIIPRLFLLAR